MGIPPHRPDHSVEPTASGLLPPAAADLERYRLPHHRKKLTDSLALGMRLQSGRCGDQGLYSEPFEG
jgi:hypothetical protein